MDLVLLAVDAYSGKSVTISNSINLDLEVIS